MKHHRLFLPVAGLVATIVMAGSAPALGQDDPTKQKEEEKTVTEEQRKRQQDRLDQRKQDQEQKEEQLQKEKEESQEKLSDDPASKKLQKPGEALSQQGAGKMANKQVKDMGGPLSDPEARAARKIMLEEAKYRIRMAKVKRLRQLAKEQGNEERLAALYKLELKMTELYKRNISAEKSKMKGPLQSLLEEKMKRGRSTGKSLTGDPLSRGKSGDKLSDRKNKNAPGTPEKPGKPKGSGKDTKKDKDEGGGL